MPHKTKKLSSKRVFRSKSKTILNRSIGGGPSTTELLKQFGEMSSSKKLQKIQQRAIKSSKYVSKKIKKTNKYNLLILQKLRKAQKKYPPDHTKITTLKDLSAKHTDHIEKLVQLLPFGRKNISYRPTSSYI